MSVPCSTSGFPVVEEQCRQLRAKGASELQGAPPFEDSPRQRVVTMLLCMWKLSAVVRSFQR